MRKYTRSDSVKVYENKLKKMDKNDKKKYLYRYFVKYKKNVFRKFFANYCKHYVYHLFSREKLIGVKLTSLPTFYEMYQIDALVYGKRCHYNSVFKDFSMLNEPKEFLLKKFTKREIPILLSYSTKQEKRFITNLFVQGYEIRKIMDTYQKKLKLENEKLFGENEENLLQKDGVPQIQQENDFVSEKSNFLSSLLGDSSESFSIYKERSYFIRTSTNFKCGSNHRIFQDSVSSIELLADKIQKCEDEKNKVRPTRKEENDRIRKYNVKKTIDNEVMITSIDSRKNVSRPISKTLNPRHPNGTKESLYSDNLKFRNVKFFVERETEKKKDKLKKRTVFRSIIEQYNKKYIQECVFLNKINDQRRVRTIEAIPRRHRRIRSDSKNNSSNKSSHREASDIFAYQNDLKVEAKTERLLRKVKSKLKGEINNLKKSTTIERIVRCPSIYFPDIRKSYNY